MRTGFAGFAACVLGRREPPSWLVERGFRLAGGAVLGGGGRPRPGIATDVAGTGAAADTDAALPRRRLRNAAGVPMTVIDNCVISGTSSIHIITNYCFLYIHLDDGKTSCVQGRW